MRDQDPASRPCLVFLAGEFPNHLSKRFGLALHQWSYRYVRNVARFAAIRHERKKINTPKEICSASAALRSHRKQLLVFSVTPFKIDQNKNHNHSTDKDKV